MTRITGSLPHEEGDGYHKNALTYTLALTGLCGQSRRVRGWGMADPPYHSHTIHWWVAAFLNF